LAHTQRHSSSLAQREPQRVQAPNVWPGALMHCCRSHSPPSLHVPAHVGGGGVGATVHVFFAALSHAHGTSASTSQRKNGSFSACP
jgi:hypothetical protein